eukprot:TRINITY_DN10988_c0_g1_i1.p1 TRINITY_DN10988_c0_g1~~TRINITY_DN10988_c0_g1_i1.p1  ORF type:complete len:235 (+),score=22.07 TRINITY_DN10988_c0_g1_i1:156-860(+)
MEGSYSFTSNQSEDLRFQIIAGNPVTTQGKNERKSTHREQRELYAKKNILFLKSITLTMEVKQICGLVPSELLVDLEELRQISEKKVQMIQRTRSIWTVVAKSTLFPYTVRIPPPAENFRRYTRWCIKIAMKVSPTDPSWSYVPSTGFYVHCLYTTWSKKKFTEVPSGLVIAGYPNFPNNTQLYGVRTKGMGDISNRGVKRKMDDLDFEISEDLADYSALTDEIDPDFYHPNHG